MPDAAIRSLPPVPATAWLKALPPAMRFVLHGDARVRAAAGAGLGSGILRGTVPRRCCRTTRATLWLGPDEYLLLGSVDATAIGDPRAPPATRSKHSLGDLPHALVDISHRQFALRSERPPRGRPF